MAISVKDKLNLIKVMTEDYNEFGGYSDDAKNSAALDQLVTCVWQVTKYPEVDEIIPETDPLENP